MLQFKSEELTLQVKSEEQIAGEFLLAWGSQPFGLFRPSVDCMKLIHIMEGNLLYSKSTI